MMRTNDLYVSRCPRKSLKIGAPERSRTPNPQIRSLVLYPVELRARTEQQAGCAGGHNYSSRMQQGKADHRGGRWPVAPGKTT
jgi:hypothetical protein